MSNAEPSQLERITVSVWRKYKQGNSTAIEERYDKIMPF